MRTATVLTFGLMAAFAAPAMAQPLRASQITAAQPAPDDRARQWLTLIDDGDVGRAWQEAGKALKSQTDATAWTARIKAVRTPMGAMASRNLKRIDLSHPDRAVVQYDSVFAHKAAALETVTLGLQGGGWSVIDYEVQ